MTPRPYSAPTMAEVSGPDLPNVNSISTEQSQLLTNGNCVPNDLPDVDDASLREAIEEQRSEDQNMLFDNIPAAITIVGLCFTVKTELEPVFRQIEQTRKPNTLAPDLATNITDFYNYGLDAFVLARTKMQYICTIMEGLVSPRHGTIGAIKRIIGHIQQCSLQPDGTYRDTFTDMKESFETIRQGTDDCGRHCLIVVEKFEHWHTLTRTIQGAFPVGDGSATSIKQNILTQSWSSLLNLFIGAPSQAKRPKTNDHLPKNSAELLSQANDGITQKEILIVLNNDLSAITVNQRSLHQYFDEISHHIQAIQSSRIPILEKSMNKARKTSKLGEDIGRNIKEMEEATELLHRKLRFAHERAYTYYKASMKFINRGIKLVTELRENNGASREDKIETMKEYYIDTQSMRAAFLEQSKSWQSKDAVLLVGG